MHTKSWGGVLTPAKRRNRSAIAKRDTEFEAFESGTHRDSPEHVLMRAVLEDAIKCYRRPKRPSEHALARRWIFEADECYLFSFEHVCEELGLVPEVARRVLRGKNGEAA